MRRIHDDRPSPLEWRLATQKEFLVVYSLSLIAVGVAIGFAMSFLCGGAEPS